MIRMSEEKLTKILLKIIMLYGVTKEKGKHLVENIVRSEMRGIKSHGTNNFISYLNLIERGIIDPNGEPKIINETASTAIVDGNRGFGQYICKFAAMKAVEKAKKCVVGTIVVRNSGHIGHASDYTRMILEKNMIGIMYANTYKGVAPFGGKTAILGSNPLSYALPAGKEEPIVIDFSTSITAGSKLGSALKKGEKIPKGWAIDSNGEVVTDPKKLFIDPSDPIKWGDNYTGALLPAAGHKGYALALFIDVMTGALAGGRVNGDVISGENFVFIQAINPDGFISRDLYNERVDKLIIACKSSKLQKDIKEILIPGEPEIRHEQECARLGIPIEEKVWEGIVSIARKGSIDIDNVD